MDAYLHACYSFNPHSERYQHVGTASVLDEDQVHFHLSGGTGKTWSLGFKWDRTSLQVDIKIPGSSLSAPVLGWASRGQVTFLGGKMAIYIVT